MTAALAVPTTAPAPSALSRPMLWSPSLDLPVRLAASTSTRAMERAVLRPVDLTRTHGVNVLLEHLVEMARAYSPQFEAGALNFDHSYGGPAHGLASRIWLDGELLWCRMEQLSDEAIAALSSGQWPRCSSEFWMQHPITSRPYWCGLALLGAQVPAVPGLPGPVLMSVKPPAGAARRIYRMDAGNLPEARRLELRLRYPDAYSRDDAASSSAASGSGETVAEVTAEHQRLTWELAAERKALERLTRELAAERKALASELGITEAELPPLQTTEQREINSRHEISPERHAELAAKYPDAYPGAHRASRSRAATAPTEDERDPEQRAIDRRNGITDERYAELRRKFHSSYSQPTPPRGGKAA